MTIGGMTAYFTDTESVVNEFTVGKISIKLTEPRWNPENGKDITPLKEVAKDPMVWYKKSRHCSRPQK